MVGDGYLLRDNAQVMQQTVADMQEEMQRAKQVVRTMEDQAGDKDAEIAKLATAVAKLEGSVSHSKGEYEKTRAAMIQLSTTLSQVQVELDAKSQENEQVKAMCAELIGAQEAKLC
eukprot:1191976-Prorocentrum_minimum.AAC.6